MLEREHRRIFWPGFGEGEEDGESDQVCQCYKLVPLVVCMMRVQLAAACCGAQQHKACEKEKAPAAKQQQREARTTATATTTTQHMF